METTLLKNVKNISRKWFLLLVLGFILIAVGIWVFFTPLLSYITLSVLFAFTFLVAGIIEITYAISTRASAHWGWTLASGIIDFIVGMILVLMPGISMLVLPLYIGFAILFRGMTNVGWSLALRRQKSPDWGILLAIGILGMLFALILLWNPLFAGLTIVYYTAFAFVVTGIYDVYMSLRLRRIKSLTV